VAAAGARVHPADHPRREAAPVAAGLFEQETGPDLDGRELLRRYGRDPRRPSWADTGRGEADTESARPARRQRRRHVSTCADCGQAAETTFRPDPSRPVYCDDCYGQARQQRRAAGAGVATAS
jgi:CxxC-x17-CxxC domain-containing protein